MLPHGARCMICRPPSPSSSGANAGFHRPPRRESARPRAGDESKWFTRADYAQADPIIRSSARVTIVDCAAFDLRRRPDAQGKRVGRRHRHLPPGGAPVHRQADRAGQNFAAQAVIAIENTRLLNELREIAAAADRHRRRAQGHQPLDLRSADRARYARRIGGAAMRCEQAIMLLTGRRGLPARCELRLLSRVRSSTPSEHPFAPGRGTITGRAALEGKTVHIPDVLADPEYYLHRRQKIGRLPHHPRRSAAARGSPDRRDRADATGGAAVHRQADRTGHHLRRPGGDRDRERAAVRRGAGAHARAPQSVGSCRRSARSARRSVPRSTCRPCSTPSSPRRRSSPAPRPARSTVR